MQELTLILMHKNLKTGVLDKELCVLSLEENGELLSGIYVSGDEPSMFVHMFVTTACDVTDWEFQAIFDYYDTELYEDVASVKEIEENTNPIWEISFPYIADELALSEKIKFFLTLHKKELELVKESIKDVEDEYNAM